MHGNIGLFVGKQIRGISKIGRTLEFSNTPLKLHNQPNLVKVLLRRNKYKFVLLSYDFLGRDIFEICKFIKFKNKSCIIIATMSRCRISVESKLFDMGVNDVVVGKQANEAILAKRIKRHLSNCKISATKESLLQIGTALVDFQNGKVWQNGKVNNISNVKAKLLKYMIDNSGKIITRQELINSHIWQNSVCPPDDGGKSIDMVISQLRKLIENDSKKPRIIVTIRKKGWMLMPGLSF